MATVASAGVTTTTTTRPVRVTIARDPWKIIGWLLLRLAIGEIGVVVGLSVPGVFGTATLVVGSVVVAYTTLLAAIVLAIRLEVHPGELHVVAGPVRARYPLAGAVVERLQAPADARQFETALGSFGIELGPGHLDDVPADVVRLDPSSTITLIHAGSRRLAVAVSHEPRFRRALRAAGATPVSQEARDSR